MSFTNCKIVMHKVMETKKKTRQKPAFIKIAVDDEFIDKLHGTMFAGLNDKLPMTCLSLCWDEPQEENKEVSE